MVQFPERYKKQTLSTVFAFDAKSGVTSGFVDGLVSESSTPSEEMDSTSRWIGPIDWGIIDTQALIEHTSHLKNHPFHLPLVLLELFMRENTDETNAIHKGFGDIEDLTGITDWFYDPMREKQVEGNKEIEKLTREWRTAPRLQNRIPFHERRWNFISHYVDFLLGMQETYREACKSWSRDLDDSVCEEIIETLENMRRLATDHLNEIQCLYRRAQSVVDLVSSCPFTAQGLTY